jgi:proteasome accessory factor A
VETQDFSGVDTEIDWIIKKKLIDSYAAKHGMDFTNPRIAQIDLTYHDVRPGRGLHSLLVAKGRAARVVTDDDVIEATTVPPQTTRARLRGEFVAAAQDAGRDYTVDWVHLKLNDQAQRTVLLKDPFRSTDDRVTKLIEAM